MPLPGMPAGQLHRSPSIALLRDTIYVAASVFPIEGTAVDPRPIYVARIPGGPISAPPGDFQFVFPKLVASRNGGIHLIWGEYEPKRADLLTWDDAGPMTIWHSVLARGQWSKPAEAFRSPWLEWPRDSWNVAIDDADVLHVVVWTFGENRSGLVHLTGTSLGWHANQTPYAPPFPRAAINAKRDSVWIAFGGISVRPADTTGVTIAASANRGATWTSAVVHRLGGRRVDQLQFLRQNDRLYLAWAEAPPGRFGRDTLRVVRLDEMLRSTQIAAVPLREGVSTISVTAACGSLLFLAETLSQRPQTIVGAIAASGAVTEQSLRPPGEPALFSGIASSSQTVVAVLAIRPDTTKPARSVLMSRPAC